MKKIYTVLIFSLALTSFANAGLYQSTLPKIVATFGNQKITDDDYSERIIDIVSAPMISKRVSSTFIRSTILKLQIKKEKIIIPKLAIKVKSEQIIKQAGGIDGFKRELLRAGMDWYSLKSIAYDAVAIEILARKASNIDSETKVSPEIISKTMASVLKMYKNPVFYGCRKPCVATILKTDILQRDFVNFIILNSSSEFRLSVLNEQIFNRRVLLYARENSIKLSSLDIQKYLSKWRHDLKRESIRLRLLKPLTLEQYLAEQGMTVNEYVKKDLFVAQATVHKIIQDKLTNDELEKYYNKTKDDYKILYAYQLFFPFNLKNHYSPINVTKSMEKMAFSAAKSVKNKLQKMPEKGLSIKLLDALSKDVDGCFFGKIGYICKSISLKLALKPSAYNLDYENDITGKRISPIRYPHPLLVKTAFSLKKGEISKLIKTQYGFHFILITGSKYPKNFKSIDKILYDRLFRIYRASLQKKLTNKYPAKIFIK